MTLQKHNSYTPSSMLYWHPLIVDLPIPQPDTRIVEIPHSRLTEMIHGGSTLNEYSETFSEIMDALGPFPIFLRTDHSSQKHSFKQTCRLPSSKSLFGHILELVDTNMVCGLEDNALVFRRWLDLDAGFVAFNGHLPINVEARLFIRDGRIQCIHPYWPEDAIQSWYDNKKMFEDRYDTKLTPAMHPSWRRILKSQNDIIAKSTLILEQYAGMVSQRVGDGYWSVDFALGIDGQWYLIDMAEGELSYHYPGCTLQQPELQTTMQQNL